MNNSCHVGNMGRPLASLARRAGEDQEYSLGHGQRSRQNDRGASPTCTMAESYAAAYLSISPCAICGLGHVL
jgi:hypothetical protein